MEPFISPRYRDLLARHGLNTFAGFWQLPWDWVEDPNERRNGWSGASRHTLVDGEADRFSMFVKRQENHNYRSLRHPYRGRPTFFRDFSNIRRMEQMGVPTVEPVFYGERQGGGKLQAVLATVTLEGYSELNSVFASSSLAAPVRQAILQRIVDAVRLMHRHHLQHNSLSGKHVMVKLGENDTFDLRILDLEKMKRSWRLLDTAVRELEKFIRHSPTLTPDEHAEFVRHYARDWSPAQRRNLGVMINQRMADKCSTKGLTAPVIHLSD
jgi:hypothetical protein